jgi:Domain of unknown function (DUF4350)
MNKRRTFFLIVFVALLLYSQLNQDRSIGSSFSTTPQGVAAFRAVLQNANLDIGLWRKPFKELSLTESNNLLLVIEPEKELVDTAKLLDWVSRGNIVVDVSNLGKIFSYFSSSSEVKVSPESVLSEGELREQAVGCSLDNAGVCNKVETIALKHFSSYKKNNEQKKDEKVELVVKFGDDKFFAARKKHGNGEVWWVVDSSAILNENIDRGDNLRFFYQLSARANKILFDEFHHGYLEPSTGGAKNREDVIKLLIVFLTILLIVGALSRSVRFGQVTPENDANTSSSIEFAAACGLLLQAHQASSALRYYLDAVIYRLFHKFGISLRLINREEALDYLIESKKISEEEGATLRIAFSQVVSNAREKEIAVAIKQIEKMAQIRTKGDDI